MLRFFHGKDKYNISTKHLFYIYTYNKMDCEYNIGKLRVNNEVNSFLY